MEHPPPNHGGGCRFHLRLAAAATAVVVVGDGVGVATATTAAVLHQQQHDDDQQDPVAVVAAEQITQTHTLHLLYGATPSRASGLSGVTLHSHSMWAGTDGERNVYNFSV